MHRLRLALAALVLFAASCGGSDTEELLTDLGLSDEEAACLTREYEARDLDVDKLLRADDSTDLTDEELSGLTEVAAVCSAAVADDDTTDAGNDSDTDDSSGSDDPPDADDSPDTDDAADGDDSSDGDGDDDAGDDDADGDDTEPRELSPLEQELIDSLEAEGLDPVAGVCLLTELEAAGFSIFDLMALGLNETAEPHPDMIAAFLRCGDEFVEAGIMDLGDIFSGDGFTDTSDVDTYGDDAELDGLWDACDSGDWVACDELFWLSPIDSEYEAFGSSCALSVEPTSGGCAQTYGGAEGAYGDDPRLDSLYDSCAAGDMVACDDLYWESPIDSDYEAFALSCGGTLGGFNSGTCADGGEPFTYGDDADLDADWDACEAGDMAACDSLYIFSPFDSDYEAFGNRCGGRSDEDLFGDCEATFG